MKTNKASFVGKAGAFVQDHEAAGIDRNEIFITNVVNADLGKPTPR